MRDHQTTFVAGSGAPGLLPKCRETVCRCVVIGAAIACGLAAGEAAAAVTAQPPAARQEETRISGLSKRLLTDAKRRSSTETGERGQGHEPFKKGRQRFAKADRRGQIEITPPPTAKIGIEPEQKFAESIRVPAEVGIGRRLGAPSQQAASRGADQGWESPRSPKKNGPAWAAAAVVPRGLGPSSCCVAGSACRPIFTRRSCPPTMTWVPAAISSGFSIAPRSAALNNKYW